VVQTDGYACYENRDVRSCVTLGHTRSQRCRDLLIYTRSHDTKRAQVATGGEEFVSAQENVSAASAH